ncbi:unnamed protein product [Orchesella dallaii]|uniref:Odorant receptor n=1 Tax=Orchesella dallaii TaxID=48710 RepID=A0ABP1S7R5_9HEXA
MEFSEAAIDLLLLLQRVIEPPLIIELPNHQKLISNPNHTKYHKVIWKTAMLANMFLSAFACIEIAKINLSVKLPSSEQEVSGYSGEAVCVYIVYLTVNLGCIATHFTLNNYTSDLIFVATQSLKFINERKLRSQPAISKIQHFMPKLIVYSIPTAFVIIIGIHFLVSYLRPYDPLQAHASSKDLQAITKFLLQFGGSLVFGVPAAIGLLGCFQILMGMIAFTEVSVYGCGLMYDGGPVIHAVRQYNFQRNILSRFKESFEAIPLRVIRKRRRSNVFKFNKCFSIHHQFQIIIDVTNSLSYVIITALLLFGSGIYITCFYVLVKFSQRLALIMCLAAGTYIMLYEFMVVLILWLAAVPYEKSRAFRSFWKNILDTNLESRQLRSCMLLAYSAGPIRKVKPCTILVINDILMNATASLIQVRN